MTARFQRLSAIGVACPVRSTRGPAPQWKLTRTAHFELYSQAGDDVTRPLLAWFEQLRAFYLAQPLFKLSALAASALDRLRFRKRLRTVPPARDIRRILCRRHERPLHRDAGGKRRRIPHRGARIRSLRAERQRLRLAPWLNEGLAEAFSTVRLSETAAKSAPICRCIPGVLRRQHMDAAIRTAGAAGRIARAAGSSRARLCFTPRVGRWRKCCCFRRNTADISRN